MNTYKVADRCDFQPGQLVDNQYTVAKTLGEGSFGVVYLVEDYRRTRYALKLLRLWEVPGEMRDSLNERFDREFATGQIRSDNLVQSLSYGRVRGNPYIVMEYCPGGDLEPLLGKGDYRNSQVCRDILLGLQALHAHHMVHRDLKPENVLFKQNGMAALTDFGIVGDSSHRMTVRNIFGKPNQIFGTYAYMPPEQVGRARDGATVMPTTDIFSFGVLAYQLLTGVLPFGTLESHNDLARYQIRGRKGDWSRDRLYHVTAGQQWLQVMEGCLNPDYKARLQTVGEVLRLLPRQQAYPHQQSHPPQQAYPQQRYPQPSASLQALTCQLRVMKGEERGRVYDFARQLRAGKRSFNVGRQADNDVFVRTPHSDYLSRYHCTIMLNDGQWMVRDGQQRRNDRQWTASLNGTYVNDHKVAPTGYYLHSGDMIRVGDVTLRFENY